jgi:hypothetical protein
MARVTDSVKANAIPTPMSSFMGYLLLLLHHRKPYVITMRGERVEWVKPSL